MNITIPKGSHYCFGWSLGSVHFGTKSMAFRVRFDESCLALNGVKDCDGDWNKLFGFGYGYHKSNSIRIVWKSVNGQIRIGAYIYESGVRKSKGFATIHVETDAVCAIDYDPVSDLVYFTCNDKQITMSYNVSPTVGYNLKPYFGGDCNAPETMYIDMVAVPIPARALVNKVVSYPDEVYKRVESYNYANAVFWLVANSIVGLVVFSFIVEQYVGWYGISFGVLIWVASQYRKFKLGKISIFNQF